MRLPPDGHFVDGSPDGGTIVRAAVLNSLLGEIGAVLALFGVEPQTTGDLPGDHHQLADLLARHWLRVGGSPPLEAFEGSVWLDTLEDPPVLYVRRDGVWQPVRWIPAPPSPSPSLPPAPPAIEAPPFDDLRHGSRGGGDLHAVATEFTAGFLSPAGHRTLNQLQAHRPRYYRSEWIPVSPGQVVQVNHNLGQVPDFVQTWFRPASEGPVRRVDPYLNGERQLVGYTLYEVTPAWLRLRVSETAWGGYTAQGYRVERSGEYRIVCLTHGDPGL